MEAPPEPKSGVSGSLCLAVPDQEAEFVLDLAMSVNCMLPMACPGGHEWCADCQSTSSLS